MGRWTLAVVLVAGVFRISAAEIAWHQLPPLPDAHGFASPLVGISGQTLLVGGGANFSQGPIWDGGKKVWHDDVFALELGGREWRRMGKLPGPLAYAVSVSVGDGVLCAGGSDAGRHFANVFVLRIKDGALTREDLPPLPRPMAMSAGARVGDIVYLAGGQEGPGVTEPLGTFLALDLGNIPAGWKELPPWPGPGRFQAVAAASGEYFYLFSGLRPKPAPDVGLDYLKDAYRYSPRAGWEKLPDLPFPAAAAASPAPADPSGIYLVGGVDGGAAGKSPREFFHVPQRIQVYHPAEKRWSDAGNAPVGRVCVSTTEWDGRWILPSGERSAGIRSPEVWSLALPDQHRERISDRAPE